MRNATRWIDTVVRTVRPTCLCADDFDSARQSLLDNYDSRDARVGRARGDVELHKRLSDCKTPASTAAITSIAASRQIWLLDAKLDFAAINTPDRNGFEFYAF